MSGISSSIIPFTTKLNVFLLYLHDPILPFSSLQEHTQMVPMTRVKEYVNAAHAEQPFTDEEFEAAVERMTDANQIMVADEMLFLI